VIKPAAFLAASLMVLGSPGTAQPREAWADTSSSPAEVLARYPRAARVWHAAVPAPYRRARWLYQLDGTHSDVQFVNSAGREYAIGSVCKPHDCGNGAVFMIALDQRRAVGGVTTHPARGPSGERFFGAPSADERAILTQWLAPARTDR